MTGLLSKILLEVRLALICFSVGLAAIMALLTALLPKVLGNIHEMFDKLPMIKPIITALLGVDPGDKMSAELSQAFLWVHPTVLTLIWAHEAMYCTRMPAGEIDRGTADFLLCQPVSRWTVFVAESIGWLLSGVIILLSGYVGHRIAGWWFPAEMELPASAQFMVLINLLTVYLAIGSFAFLISALSDRRGRAIGVIFAVLLGSFLLNFLAQFVDWAKSVSPYLSVMAYYRPAIILQSREFPTTDILILVGIAVVLWLAAGVTFRRRSICTV